VKLEFTYRSKYTTVGRLLAGRHGSLLDIGARDGMLRRYLPGTIDYRSADVAAGSDFVIDLERRLPFDDRSFDFVVALDVLEHVDNLHLAFDELTRIARSAVIVALPNMAFWAHRVAFALRGRLNTDKYDLSAMVRADRHRWLTTSAQAATFMLAHGAGGGLELSTVVNEAGGSRPSRLVGWALMRAGLPVVGLLSDRTIGVFERRAV
jgi:hypothetical protein